MSIFISFLITVPMGAENIVVTKMDSLASFQIHPGHPFSILQGWIGGLGISKTHFLIFMIDIFYVFKDEYIL